MHFTKAELTQMAEIFNDAISGTEFEKNIVSWEDFEPSKSYLGTNNLIRFKSDAEHISRIFSRLSQNRIIDQGQFYHFKNIDIAKQIISERVIQTSNLLSNHKNDFAEYTELFQRLGLINLLIPADYCLDAANVSKRANRPIDDDRNDILILCFSKEGHKEKFWKEYAKEDTGVCLVFRFLSFVKDLEHTYEFRDVIYDHGYRFDFLNKVNHLFSFYFNRILPVEGITKFAKHYKRGSYEWENETRLVFDYGKLAGYKEFIQQNFPLKNDGERRYAEIPLIKNVLFELTIDEIIVGKNVSEVQYEEISNLLKMNFPKAYIWQRKNSSY
jgi:hypothetical protein